MKPGDQVQIKTKERTYSGILLPEPELLQSESIILKLESGYNIGIDKKKIKSQKVLQKSKIKSRKSSKLKSDKNLPDIPLLSTGGTISSKVDYKSGGVVADYTAADFIEMCPELLNIANLQPVKLMSIMSEDMNHKHWQSIANEAAKYLNKDNRGIIITQGTDTLHFTTAALSFMIKNLNKPIIVTGAQRSIDRGSSDAFMNLICSTKAASELNGAVVASCMHGTTNDDFCLLNRGTTVRKLHTTRRDAFRPVNELPLAKVYYDRIEILNKDFPERNNNKVFADTRYEAKIALIYAYPDMDPDILDFYLDKKYKGIVIAGTALGHVPTSDHSLLPGLTRAKNEGIPIIMSSQTLYGKTNPYVYTNLRKLSIGENCIFGENMLPEVAYIKLGWVLGHTKKYDKIKEMMLTNVAGEIITNINPASFLY